MQVKSVLDPYDPCEDENDNMQDDERSKGPDSLHDDQPCKVFTKPSKLILTENKDADHGEVNEGKLLDKY